jgi:hypothetical protein
MANHHPETITDTNLKSSSSDSPRIGGDFRLREVSIHSKSNPNIVQLNSPGVFSSLDIFEDLFSNVLRGTLAFIDNQGIAELIPLIGDEDLVISFGTPGSEGTGTDFEEKKDLTSKDKNEEVSRQIFKIYDCVEAPLEEEGTGKAYVLSFVSHEYIENSKNKISKGYKQRFYHEVVKDALDKLNTNINPDYHKNSFIEKTGTSQNVIVPNWTPFQAINFCASRSTSTAEEEVEIENSAANQLPVAQGSLFVFYEKLGTGFFYESIESMIIKQKTNRSIPLYQYTPKSGGGRTSNIELQYFGVDKFEIKSSFKTLENLGFGMYGSKLIAYDPIRMKYDEVKYDYYEKEESSTSSFVDPKSRATVETANQSKDDSQRIFANFIATDIHPTARTQNKLISETSDFLGSNDAHISLATTTRDHDAMFVPPAPESFGTGATAIIINPITPIGVSGKTFKDNEAKPNKIENWLLQRQAQLQEFDNIIVTFTIAGNSSRHVGDLIRFEVPSSIKPLPPAVGEVGHQLYSGYYLISKIHHRITTTGYETDMEIIKNSFAKRIPGQKTTVSSDGS